MWHKDLAGAFGMISSMKKNRITMQDVAREAGVSQSTVSFVLNGNSDVHIAEKTKERIHKAVAQLGYSHRATGAVRKRGVDAPFIGFMVDEIATSIFAAISIEGAQEAAWKAGYVLDVAMTGSNKSYERMVLDRWENEGVAGIIYSSILTRAISPPKQLNVSKTVLLNCHSEGRLFTSVMPSEILGGMTATEALIDAGRKRIAFVGGEEWMEAANDRYEGYRSALISAGIKLDNKLVRTGNFLPSGGYAVVKALLIEGIEFDGLFCANDLMAIGAYEALKEAGISIPDQVSIVGYDDQELARHLSPPLTTVLLPHREMGQWAVNWILTEGAETKRSPKVVRLECPLVGRQSC
ncbi:LacI family DNA-binding transcriptional regulator [Litorivicinus lipolyticus]|uniref:LacI family DNA-binding transcriptional regulator n=1 Tax=Litorivicinus lipolyticus TaxID=418701 RepID=UPI003B592071